MVRRIAMKSTRRSRFGQWMVRGHLHVPAPAPAPTREDLRVKLDVQQVRRDLNNRRRGKRVVFEVSEARSHPEASASGSKKDGEEMHDEEFYNDVPETMMKEVRQSTGVVDGLHSTLEVVLVHWVDRATTEMGSAVHEEPASEPEVLVVGPSETRLDIEQAVAMTHDELSRCVQNTSDQVLSHLATEAEDMITVPIREA
ncbi:UNVERIFIED_CONTAM: hypothetical protein Slati_2256500 [Sesamum latifolium]|uniref:Uncharacterized protein n=1 Tax=Sesamum latifolium TaxID=2727402 RepID=A0AAW2WV73_9LAMI